MKENEIFAFALTDEEKAKVKQSFELAQRMGKKSKFESLDTIEQVKAYCQELKENAAKRKAASKKAAPKRLSKKQIATLKEEFGKAFELGMTFDQIIDELKKQVKAVHNAKIQQQIEELKRKMI